MLDEIIQRAERKASAAEKIIDLFCEILSYKPCFFEGFIARATEEKIFINELENPLEKPFLRERAMGIINISAACGAS